MQLNKGVQIIFLLGFLLTYGQQKKSAGDGYFFSYAYKDAIAAYQKDISKGIKLTDKQTLNLADSYFEIKNFEKANQLYHQVYKKDSLLSEYHLNRLLRTVASKESLDSVSAFITRESLQFKKELLENASFNIKLLQSSNNSVKKDSVFNLTSNGPNTDFAPTFFGDSLLFTSARAIVKRKNYTPKGEGYLNIFKGALNQNGQLGSVLPFNQLAKSDYHKATPFYSPSLNSVFYVLSNTYDGELDFDENGKNALAIGMQKLGRDFRFLWRDLSTSFYYPFYDEETSRLYFAANLEGGYGGTDLYYVNTNQGQIMSAPINLGPKINSPGNEIAPYLFEGSLYFSSDVFYGLGGMDIYKANIIESGFTLPVNLGTPVNSIADDFGYIIKNYRQGLLAYFSSNREGGKGKDDVYGLMVDEKPGLKTFAIRGEVTLKSAGTKVPNATVQLYSMDGQLLNRTTTNDEGSYEIEVPWQKGIQVSVSKKRHSTFDLPLDEQQMESVQKRNLNPKIALYDNLVEEKEGQTVVKLRKFYFSKSAFTITADIAQELNRVVDFVKLFPQVQLRIETHTDSRGGNASNFKLTQARSDAIKQYLLQKGVAESSILYSIGYGEDKILNTCKNGVFCLEMMHKQNQRSLIVILNDNILFE